MRLMAEIVQDRLEGPRILFDAWATGQVSDLDLRGLIPDIWLYVDWPERTIGAVKWVQMFWFAPAILEAAMSVNRL
jgi:hypothetical protein